MNKKKILIIDDEKMTVDYVKRALEREGYETETAYDGEEGIEKFHKEAYDLILLDLKMPGVMGQDVLKVIRQENPFVDVIIYTNLSDYSDIKALTNIGIDGYINKGPEADLDELIMKIKEKLDPINAEGLKTLLENTPEEFFEKGDK